ncbi:MAG TPA: hypothetical protein PKA27_02365 [Fimbriimonadaceae bacterium]|nr:hypothetical protein [Fimbriimonadaceae bacterium]
MINELLRNRNSGPANELPGTHQYLASVAATAAKKRSDIDGAMTQAIAGKSLEEQRLEKDVADLRKATDDLAAKTAELDDSEFESFRAQFESQLAARPQKPGQAALGQPNLLQAGLGIAGALVDPNNAASHLAAPLQSELQEQQRADVENRENFEIASQEHAQRMAWLERQMNYSRQDSRERQRSKQDQLDNQSRRADRNLAVAEGSLKDFRDNRRADKIREDDQQFKIDLAAGKFQNKDAADAWKVLNDPKTTRVARAGAMARLESNGINLPPDLKSGYLESTYYEDNQVASTRGKELKNQFDESTMEGRIKRVMLDNDRVAAQTLFTKAQTAFRTLQGKWYGKEAQARINRSNYQLNRARASADDAFDGLTRGGRVTETAFFNAVNKNRDALAKSKAAEAYTRAELEKQRARYEGIKAGKINSEDEAAELAELEVSMDSAAAMLAAFQVDTKEREERLEDIYRLAGRGSPRDPQGLADVKVPKESVGAASGLPPKPNMSEADILKWASDTAKSNPALKTRIKEDLKRWGIDPSRLK